jgi:hypothetical protein
MNTRIDESRHDLIKTADDRAELIPAVRRAKAESGSNEPRVARAQRNGAPPSGLGESAPGNWPRTSAGTGTRRLFANQGLAETPDEVCEEEVKKPAMPNAK